LHVHPRTVQRLVERGQLAAVHLGSAVRFDPDDLGGLISGHKREQQTARTPTADRVRRDRGARVTFGDRLRSDKHEHRTAHA
jgi:excisionase family DNA binding protein